MPARLITAIKPLACGLVWRSLAGRNPKREIAQLQRSLRAVRVQRSDAVAGFLARGDLPRRAALPRKLWSAAAMFASIGDVDPTALLVLPIPEVDSLRGGDREFSVIGLHQRIPLPDFDLVLPEHRLGDEVNRLSQTIFDLTNVRPTLYGDGPSAVPLTWDDVATRGHGLPMEAQDASQYALAAMAALLAAGLGFYGWDIYQGRSRAQQQRAQVATDPTPIYRSSLEQSVRNTVWSGAPAVIEAIARVTRIPAQIASFNLDKTILCDLVQRKCTAQYIRPASGPATFADFRATAPDKLFTSVDYAFDGYRVSVSIVLPPSENTSAQAAVIDSFLAEGELPLRWWPAVQQLESLPLQATLGSQPTRVAGSVPPGASEAQIQGLVRVWPVTANVPAWAVAGLPALPGLVWDSFELTFGAAGGVSANLKGGIHARRS